MIRRFSLGSRKLGLRLLLLFSLVTAILTAIGAMAYRESRAHQAAEDKVTVINEQLRGLNRFLVAMLDVETGQRGYLLTGRKEYLAPYEDGIERGALAWENLMLQFKNEPQTQAYLNAVSQLKASKLLELSETIMLYDSGRREDALNLVNGGAGKQTMDQIRSIVGAVISAKRTEYDSIKRVLERQSERARFSLAVFLAAICACMFGGYAVLYRDLTERRRLRAQVDEARHHDTLTGLPNRSFFMTSFSNVLTHAHRDATRTAVLLIDLDNFGAVNARHGYASGDALLQDVAARLREMARKNDIIARLDSDRFVMLVPNVPDLNELRILADRITHTLTPAFVPAMREQYLGASIGITVYPDDALQPERLLMHAEIAVAKAKQEGKRRYRFFDDSISHAVSRTEQITNDLHRALAEQQLVLHYQPLVDLASGRIVAVEALVRWPHSELGMVPPDEFIPIAEKNGLILPLGSWVLREACLRLGEWRRKGCNWKMAVNVASAELVQADYSEIVRNALHASQLPPAFLEIEVTERTLLNNQAVAELEKIKEIGVQVALDDFGTGYSSLSYLAQFPVHHIKIDKSFVNGIPYSRSSCTLVKSMLQMATELGISVVAEGVENEQQAQFLAAAACPVVQGYLYYKPCTAEAIEAILARSEADRLPGAA